MKLVKFSDESKLPELLEWVHANSNSSVIVVMPGIATQFGDAFVLHWFNKLGDEWTQDTPRGDNGATRLKDLALVHLEASAQAGWFSLLEWHFENSDEALQAKLACG